MALGLGVEYRPEVLQNFPQGVQSLLRQGLVVGGLAGFFLNLIFPEEG
jgi:NCS2 family nucleobase:cation symporter-2